MPSLIAEESEPLAAPLALEALEFVGRTDEVPNGKGLTSLKPRESNKKLAALISCSLQLAAKASKNSQINKNYYNCILYTYNIYIYIVCGDIHV